MEAHRVAYGTNARVMDEDVKTPPDSLPVKKGDIITIFNQDGMYCNCQNENGDRIYIVAWTDVEAFE